MMAFVAAIVMQNFLDERLAYAIFAIWTMVHLIGQQVGISRVNLTINGSMFSLWKWSLIISGRVNVISR